MTDGIDNLIDKQGAELYKALYRIKELEAEVAHLKDLLLSSTPVLDSKILTNNELVIVETQLEILKNRSLQKELSLEELKSFDLLIKNKKILSEKAPVVESKPKDLMPEADLILLAAQPKKVD